LQPDAIYLLTYLLSYLLIRMQEAAIHTDSDTYMIQETHQKTR